MKHKQAVCFFVVFAAFATNAIADDVSGIVIGADQSTAACNISVLGKTSGNVTFRARWQLIAAVKCPAGTYLPAGGESLSDCVPCAGGNVYCPGFAAYDEPVKTEGFPYSEDVDQGVKTCLYGVSPVGAKSEDDCGYVLNIGKEKLYLHKNKITTPSLAVKYGRETYYANMTPVTDGEKPITSGSSYKLHVSSADGHWTVYDNTVE